MKNKVILIIGIICFYNINCFAKGGLIKGLINNELKVADEVEVNKNKEENTNIELAKEKIEKNINTEKIDNVSTTENKTDNSKVAGVLADVKALSENKIESKIENKMSAEANFVKNIENKTKFNDANVVKTDKLNSEIALLKNNIDKLSNSFANITQNKTQNQDAKTIINKEGIDIKDLAIFFLIIGGGFLALYAKFFMKSNREKKLESAHEDLFEKVKVVSNKRNLLKSVALKMKTENDINRQVINELFERYESKKFEFGIEE